MEKTTVEHIENFLKVVDPLVLPNVSYERLRLAVFPISPTGEANNGYCNGGNLPGTFRVGNTLYYQYLEWYEALEDGKLKDEALKNKAIMEGLINKDDESYDEAWKR
ncbi:hypothetical protein Tco_0597681 [Tanacetum coccineum]